MSTSSLARQGGADSGDEEKALMTLREHQALVRARACPSHCRCEAPRCGAGVTGSESHSLVPCRVAPRPQERGGTPRAVPGLGGRERGPAGAAVRQHRQPGGRPGAGACRENAWAPYPLRCLLYQTDAPPGRQRGARRRALTAWRLLRARGVFGGGPAAVCDPATASELTPGVLCPSGHSRRPRLPLLARLRPGGASP